MRNPVLDTNAITVEGILFWSYGISNRSDAKAIDYYPETRGRIGSRMEDLRVEAAMVQSVVNEALTWPHLRSIVEAKYGERADAVWRCAIILKQTARTQTHENLLRIVEHFCLFRKYRDRDLMHDFRLGRNAAREARSRYEGILAGWEWFALQILEPEFRGRGWVE